MNFFNRARTPLSSLLLRRRGTNPGNPRPPPSSSSSSSSSCYSPSPLSSTAFPLPPPPPPPSSSAETTSSLAPPRSSTSGAAPPRGGTTTPATWWSSSSSSAAQPCPSTTATSRPSPTRSAATSSSSPRRRAPARRVPVRPAQVRPPRQYPPRPPPRQRPRPPHLRRHHPRRRARPPPPPPPPPPLDRHRLRLPRPHPPPPGDAARDTILLLHGPRPGEGVAVAGDAWRREDEVLDDSWVRETRKKGEARGSQPDTRHLERLNWEVLVVKDNMVNAFCLPGGKIVVFTGLLDHFREDAEIATVIGHEVGHAIARHSAEMITKNLWFAILQLILLQFIFMPDLINAMSTLLLRLPFSRRMEMEADYIGLMLLAAAGKKRAELLSQAKVMEEAILIYRETLGGRGIEGFL
uniref:Peptidase M48 domain-containing protein n=1 Tax=Ananas comosus var. bracteatus TaxID=296719 RepID=A0A6V7P7U8_ANACO|nr:unnamed protein product [Ananas comosus var. bracteatus]